jgi:hypothetical protein
MKAKIIILLSIIIMTMIIGCSGGGGSPIEPGGISGNITNPSTTGPLENINSVESHYLLGCWSVHIDKDNLRATLEPDRTLDSHFNVTQNIPAPVIQVNSWDPSEEVIDVDVMIHNPFLFDVYDVRLIVYTDEIGHMLINDDNWTSLYDIPLGQIANPFKAFAKSQPDRKFAGMSCCSENLRIKCPDGNTDIKFAIDASYPGNCEEPYEISDFSQDILLDSAGSSASVNVTVLDWQDDVNAVYLHCPALTNQQLTPLSDTGSNRWETTLFNNAGAVAGDYTGYLLASSANSGSLKLYDEIVITVTPAGIPSDPKLISSIQGYIACTGIAVSGDYAYVTDWWDGLKVVDISDPTYPEIICSVDTTSAMDVKIFGNYAYVIDPEIKIVDVSNPYNSFIIGIIDIDSVSGIAVSGNFAYVTHPDGLTIVDVSDPSDPVTVSSLDSPDYASDIAVSGQYAYISYYGDPSSSLKVVDVSNPLNPQIVGDLATSYAFYLTVAKNLVYMIDNSGVRIVDVTDPVNPALLGSIYTFQPHEIVVSGDYAYLAAGSEGLKVIDVSDPENPSIVGNVVTEDASGVAYSDHNVYIADFFGGFKVINVSNPSGPEIIGHGYAHRGTDIVKKGNHVYVADGTNGLTAVDVSDPSNPRITSSFDTSWSVDIALSSHYVYLCDVYDGLNIFDISVPGFPMLVGSIDNQDDYYYGIDVVNNTAYVTSGEKGLLIIDVSDPSNPVITDSVNMIGAIDVVVSGSYAYVVVANGLAIVDLTNLIITGSLDTIDAVNIDIAGGIVYLADLEGLILIDASDPFNPQRTGSISFAYGASNVSVRGNYAYVTDYTTGLTIVDVSDSSNPEIVSQVVTNGSAESVAVSDEYAYMADNLYLLEIIKLW